MKWTDFDAIIFDLGGVLINLNYQATVDAFEKLGGNTFKQMYSQASQSNLFDEFETGKISSFHFINRLLDLLPSGTNANQVAHAWDAMILEFELPRLQLISKILKEKPVFLLSNTNDLHMVKVRRKLSALSAQPLEELFTKVYLSQEIGMRKPNPEPFNLILQENKLKPSNTLFIDDTQQHIDGAKALGITAELLQGELVHHPFFS
ncbi:MAG: HAD family phosphatase [Bacteroidetes bacterium]|nr:HAD family phosphatase [Bacteroidota bacterium]